MLERVNIIDSFHPEVFVATHLTRKELKHDDVALRVEETFDFFNTHRKEMIRWGGIAIAIIVIVAAVFYYRSSQHQVREELLSEALTLENVQVGAPAQNGAPSFTTEAQKRDAVTKAFNKLVNDYSGSQEAYIARYYLASMALDAGKTEDAKRGFREVADHADKNYASLGKLALAQLDFASGNSAEGQSLLRDLIDHPTDLVSKTQATITLARGLSKTNPAEARRLIQPLVSSGGDDAPLAAQVLSEIPQK
jgi:predicted negative regulator of RcsB-dependent stress response